MATSKCRYCKKVIDRKKAFIIPDGKSPKFCCSENEYQIEELKKENIKQSRMKCYEALHEAMCYRSGAIFPTIVNKDIESFAKGYGFDCITRTILKLTDKILWVVDNKSFKNESQKCKYVLAMIRNNLEDTYKQIKIEENEKIKERSMLKKSSLKYEDDYIKQLQKRNTKPVMDISDFL